VKTVSKVIVIGSLFSSTVFASITQAPTLDMLYRLYQSRIYDLRETSRIYMTVAMSKGHVDGRTYNTDPGYFAGIADGFALAAERMERSNADLRGFISRGGSTGFEYLDLNTPLSP
jgi:hypothetical protein